MLREARLPRTAVGCRKGYNRTDREVIAGAPWKERGAMQVLGI